MDLPDQQSERDGKDGHADIDAIDLLALTQTEGLGDDQAGRPKGRVSRRDRSCHHTKHGKDASHDAKPVATDEVHHHGGRGMEAAGRGIANLLIARLWRIVEEPHRHRGPDQRHEALGDHRTIEDGAALALGGEAAGHQRALRGMESADRATGDGDKHTGEDIVGKGLRIGLLGHIAESVPHLREHGPLDEQHGHQRHRHEEQREGEERIDLADNLVDRQHRGDDVIDEDQDDPHQFAAPDIDQYLCRTIDEDRADHDEQEHDEDEEYLGSEASQKLLHECGQVTSAMAHGEHAREVVVGGSGKDAAEDDPQIGRWTKLRAHDGTKDGARAGNVEKLDHEHLPIGHGNIVQPVGLRHGRSHPVVGDKDALHETSINNVAQDKGHQTDQKSYHPLFVFRFLLRPTKV